MTDLPHASRGQLNDDYGIEAMRRHIQENNAPLDFRGRLTLFAAFGSDEDISRLMKMIRSLENASHLHPFD